MEPAGTTLARLGAVALVRAGAVLAGFAATVTVTGMAWGVQDIALSVRRPAGGDLLSIEGGVGGVVAGASGTLLHLTLRNAGQDPRDVVRVVADSTGVRSGPASCERAGLLTVGEWNGAVTVPAGGTVTVTVPVAVAADLPAECVSAAWGLLYTAY